MRADRLSNIHSNGEKPFEVIVRFRKFGDVIFVPRKTSGPTDYGLLITHSAGSEILPLTLTRVMQPSQGHSQSYPTSKQISDLVRLAIEHYERKNNLLQCPTKQGIARSLVKEKYPKLSTEDKKDLIGNIRKQIGKKKKRDAGKWFALDDKTPD